MVEKAYEILIADVTDVGPNDVLKATHQSQRIVSAQLHALEGMGIAGIGSILIMEPDKPRRNSAFRRT